MKGAGGWKLENKINEKGGNNPFGADVPPAYRVGFTGIRITGNVGFIASFLCQQCSKCGALFAQRVGGVA